MPVNSIITGTGSYIPEVKLRNTDFQGNTFFNARGEQITKPTDQIVQKVEEISEIQERRYVSDDQDTADIATYAAQAALESAGVNGEELDTILVAHNSGNMESDGRGSRLIPNLASMVKAKLKIKNPRVVATDIIFGCPGWIQGLIMAHQAIKSEMEQRILVIGVDALSRMLDPHDMDSMLFSDGAGAVVLEAKKEEKARGILSYRAFSDCIEGVDYLKMGPSYNANETDSPALTIKMRGRNVYKYAVNTLPGLISEVIQKAGVPFSKVSKFLFHQANGKMIRAIGEKLFIQEGEDLCKFETAVPLTVKEYGNSSVATIPTLLDLILKGQKEGHHIETGDTVVMTSVGAGMTSNSMVYKF
ncbi:MAG: ketoacyl-ACP synthase III [Bacteroidota bacterium]